MKRRAAMALCLCLIMTLLPVSAQAATSMEDEILPVLAVMGVMNGDQNGRLDLSSNVTRAQFVKMAVSASALRSQGKAVSSVSPYPDVPAGAWYSGYITAARDSGLVSGYLDGTFRPDSYVTLEEGISVMLKAMGYGDADFAAGYPAAHLALYHSLKMDDGMTVSRGQAMTRGDCARLIYNCLNAKAKSGTTYALQLGYAVDNQGKINYAALAVSETQGPVLMTSLVSAAVGFTPQDIDACRCQIRRGSLLYRGCQDGLGLFGQDKRKGAGHKPLDGVALGGHSLGHNMPAGKRVGRGCILRSWHCKGGG